MDEKTEISFHLNKGAFPFGNKYGYWEHDSEFPNFWPWYFNYGFITNEIKWAAIEKQEGIRKYERGDEIIEQFQARVQNHQKIKIDNYTIV